MYNIDQFDEELQGIITTNYDEYMDEAIEQVSNHPVDFGIRVEPSSESSASLRLLKLHGSFGWQATWPISRGQDTASTLWIPPGIQKAKQVYPFNVLWGLAREMLSCEILRVIGCSLGGNDWDLISLLFTMRHVYSSEQPQIEVIDAPMHVEALKKAHPYLEVRSILEIEPIGSQLVTEFTGLPPRRFEEFTEVEQQSIVQAAGTDENWFELWLNRKAESLSIELGNVTTRARLVEQFLDA